MKLIEIGSINEGPIVLVGNAGYIVGSDHNKIQHWQVNNGEEVGQPMDRGDFISSIAVSQDGKWIMSATQSGQVAVWDTESHNKVSEFKGHSDWMYVVDISPDSTRMASRLDDRTVCVWSHSTGRQLLDPLEHDYWVAAVKFSPDGQFITTDTWESVQAYYSHDGHLLFDSPIEVGSPCNQSLAWVSNSKQQFALLHDSEVHCLDIPIGQILSAWAIHSNKSPRCIALESNGVFIAASADSSISFWDTATHKQIGPLIHHQSSIWFIAISANDNLVISRGGKIILWKLPNTLPSSYFDNVGVSQCQRDPTHCNSLATTDMQSHLPVGWSIF